MATIEKRQDQELLQNVEIDVVGNALPLIFSGKTLGRPVHAIVCDRAHEESVARRLRNYLKRLDV